MENILHIESISELNEMLNQGKPKHPLVSIIDFSKVQNFGEDLKVSSGFYSLMFKNHCHNKFKYGREYFDFQEGTLICIAPNQVASMDDDLVIVEEKKGWGLFFHPDLLHRTSLGTKMKEYTFFSYEVNEALHLSDSEKANLNDCVAKIEYELSLNIDQHSQKLIVSAIELLLNYCSRYYERQFITRTTKNRSTLVQFEKVLKDYFSTKELKSSGLPSVKYCAEQLHLSSNYMSDLLKRETGKNAQEHIHYFLIEEAKNLLLSSNLSVGEIAFQLGFDYPQYFSKLFKTKTGVTPATYRQLN